ncbi:unnamed protein product [Alopecurus aequalis]
MSLGCRHGLFLISLSKSRQVLVWDPITGDKHRIVVPDAFHLEKIAGLVNGAVLLSAGEDQHFQVVLVGAVGGQEQDARALACVYSSKTGLWGNLISTPLPYEANESRIPTMESLAVIPVPVELGKSFKMMRAEGGGLGCFVVSDCTAQLWKRKTDRDGVASWGLARTIELDMLLSLGSEVIGDLFVLGIAEENNVVFLWTWIGLFMIHLESFKFKKLFNTNVISYYHPFESVYTTEICAGGGHDVAEISLNM